MAGVKYRVVFRGEVAKGFSAHEVMKNLAAIFKKDIKKISKMFTGERISVKRNADLETCEKTKKILERAGALCHIEPHVRSSTETLTESDLIENPYDTPDEEDEDGQEEPEDRLEDEIEQLHDKTPPHAEEIRDKEDIAPPVPPLPASSETPEEDIPSAPREEGINKTALLLATMPLGAWGVHKFYLGKNLQGILYLIFSWTGIPGIIALVEFFIYLSTSAEDLNRKYKTPGSTALVLIIANIGPIILMAIAGIIAALAIPGMIALQNKVSSPAAMFKFQPLPAAPDVSGSAAMPVSGGQNGKIHGMNFSIEKAILDNGILMIRQGDGPFADVEVMIFLFLNDESPANKTFAVTPDLNGNFNLNHITPQIHMKWKEAGSDIPKVDIFTDGYTMDLEFGDIKNNQITGNIDVKLPDEMKSYIFGTFTAEIK